MSGGTPRIKAVHMFERPFLEALERARSSVPYEIGGFIVGYVARWRGEYHLIITEQVPVSSKSTTLTVEFLNEGASEVASILSSLKSQGYYVVGWYHSHPGYTCYPSRLDLKTHTIYFREFYHVGLILDPLKEEYCVFKAQDSVNYDMLPFYVWRRKGVG